MDSAPPEGRETAMNDARDSSDDSTEVSETESSESEEEKINLRGSRSGIRSSRGNGNDEDKEDYIRSFDSLGELVWHSLHKRCFVLIKYFNARIFFFVGRHRGYYALGRIRTGSTNNGSQSSYSTAEESEWEERWFRFRIQLRGKQEQVRFLFW